MQCLEGRIAFIIANRTTELSAEQMLHLPAGVKHAVKGLEDSAVLLTTRL